MISFKIELAGLDNCIEAFREKRRALSDLEVPLTQSAFFVLQRIWYRIAGKPIDGTYSGQYVAWLIRSGKYSEKMVGILDGAMIAMSAPAGGTAGELGTSIGNRLAIIGFLNPTGKIRGFLGWFHRRFGQEAIQIAPDDEREIARIFEEWIAGRA